jgi:hypothetical protein
MRIVPASRALSSFVLTRENRSYAAAIARSAKDAIAPGEFFQQQLSRVVLDHSTPENELRKSMRKAK